MYKYYCFNAIAESWTGESVVKILYQSVMLRMRMEFW